MTEVVRTRDALRDALARGERPVGLVPTMGWLHDGHRALMRQARSADATTVVTIFVNPRQFNVAADFTKYPRDEARDLAICESEGVDLVFAPDPSEIYPPGFDTVVSVGAVARPLEGAARPGHFDGVATVVAILFHLVGGDHAYFGQKDAQQVMVIRQIAHDLAIATEVIACPTVREPDGLALSSRNVHLSPAERAAAPVLHRALAAARDRWAAGERSGDALRAAMRDELAREPLAEPDYVSVADGTTLAELDRVDGPALLSLAVRFGTTRLIDNEPLGADPTRIFDAGMAAGRRILLAYLVYYAAIGTAFPYLPVFYRDLGLELAQIGALTAIQAAVQLLLAPVWGGLADRFPRTRLTLPLAAVVAAIGATILFLAAGFEAVVAGSLILYGGLSGIGPTLDARTLETLGAERRGRFGEVRAFGSLAFVVSTVAIGFLLDAEGARSLFWAYLPFLVATAVVTATIPRRVGTTRSVSLLRGAGEFLSAKGVALFLVGFTVVWASLASVTAFYSIQVVALGGSPGLVGIAWAIGAVIEVPYMYAFPRVAGWFGTERLVVVGSLAFVLRGLLAALAVDPVALVLIAPLEGIGFASVFVGGVTVLAAHAPAGLQGTAQGAFAACAGLATIVGSFGGGAIAGAVSIPGLFLVGAAVSLAGTGIVAVALLGPGTGRIAPPSRGIQTA